jgi:hypothetical protein
MQQGSKHKVRGEMQRESYEVTHSTRVRWRRCVVDEPPKPLLAPTCSCTFSLFGLALTASAGRTPGNRVGREGKRREADTGFEWFELTNSRSETW